MTEREVWARSPEAEESEEEQEFRPIGTLFLLVLYIFIFASTWGLVYFADLLARR
ncbi:MAG TPA: hypothetical protein VKY39_07000 [Aggregatilineales bacterium]|nr:hypothetical protein [Aggregatilineales bacterium]